MEHRHSTPCDLTRHVAVLRQQALGRRSWHAAAPIPPAHATRSLWQHLPTTQLLPQLLPDVSWPPQILCLLTTSHLPNENEAFSMNRHQHTFHLGRCSARTVDGAKDANFLVRPLFAPSADARRSPSMVMTMDGLWSADQEPWAEEAEPHQTFRGRPPYRIFLRSSSWLLKSAACVLSLSTGTEARRRSNSGGRAQTLAPAIIFSAARNARPRTIQRPPHGDGGWELCR